MLAGTCLDMLNDRVSQSSERTAVELDEKIRRDGDLIVSAREVEKLPLRDDQATASK